MNKIQFRRGTDAERGTVVFDSGEPGWTTDTHKLYIGDGSTYGGILVAGGGGGAGTLCELSDVNCAGTADGKVLTYQSGTWRAGGTVVAEQIPELDTSKITTGVFDAERIPEIANLKGTVPDVKIPDVETLSYGAAFGTAQIPSIGAYKITSGTFGLARIPTMDDAHIPNLETLSYGAAFGTAQIPSIGAYKIASGTFSSDRIPVLPTDRYGSAVLVDGSRAMTGAFKLKCNAGTTGMATVTGAMFFDTSDNNVKVYIA